MFGDPNIDIWQTGGDLRSALARSMFGYPTEKAMYEAAALGDDAKLRLLISRGRASIGAILR